MKKGRALRLLRLLGGNLLVFAVLFGILELIAPWVVPEYVNAYFTSDITWGNRIYLSARWGHRVRADQVNDPLTRTDPAEARILFAGDSVTFGYGIRYEDPYHQVAARLLSEESCKAVVHGVGRLHSNLPQLLASESGTFMLDAFRPNVLIYQFQPDDVRLSAARKKTEQDMIWRDRFEKFRISYLNRSAFARSLQAVIHRMYQRTRRQSLENSLFYSPKTDPDSYRRAWSNFETSMTDIRQMLSHRGIHFQIMLAPESYNVSSEPVDNDLFVDISAIDVWPSGKVRDIARRHDIPIFDPMPALQEYRTGHPEERLFFPNDSHHPNRLGHRLIGDAVAQYLRSLPGMCQ